MYTCVFNICRLVDILVGELDDDEDNEEEEAERELQYEETNFVFDDFVRR